jgi:hypothetical protein
MVVSPPVQWYLLFRASMADTADVMLSYTTMPQPCRTAGTDGQQKGCFEEGVKNVMYKVCGRHTIFVLGSKGYRKELQQALDSCSCGSTKTGQGRQRKTYGRRRQPRWVNGSTR